MVVVGEGGWRGGEAVESCWDHAAISGNKARRFQQTNHMMGVNTQSDLKVNCVTFGDF